MDSRLLSVRWREHLGAEVHLERVSLKYEGLAPWEIWLSEAQERMVIAVPPENIDALMKICESEFVEATVLGTFTDTHRLQVFYEGARVADLEMEFLHNGTPETRETGGLAAAKAP